MLLTNDKNVCPMRNNFYSYYYPDSLRGTVCTNSWFFSITQTLDFFYMKKYKLIALLLLIATVCLFAQTKTVEGTVSKPETGRPMAGATTKIVNSKTATVTDLENSGFEYESQKVEFPGFTPNDVIKTIVDII
jgi:hypothetical protein